MKKPKRSLLDPRTYGWVLEQDWPDTFLLYTKDGEARVELSPRLQAIENALIRGHSIDDTEAPKLERALMLAAMICLAKKEGGDCSSFGFDNVRQQIADDIVTSLGPIVVELLAAKTSERAELAEARVVSFVKRAAGGLVRINYPKPARGSGDVVSKKLLAIWNARALCERLRRLPTKREVCQSLEAIGVSYAQSKDAPEKWRDLFLHAGLSSLPD